MHQIVRDTMNARSILVVAVVTASDVDGKPIECAELVLRQWDGKQGDFEEAAYAQGRYMKLATQSLNDFIEDCPEHVQALIRVLMARGTQILVDITILV